MINTDQNIKELLRQKFQNFEPEPPIHVWGNIEKSLDAKNAFFSGRMKYYAATLLLAILITIAYFSFYPNTENTNFLDVKQQLTTNEQIIASQKNDDVKITEPLIVEEPIKSDSKTLLSNEHAEEAIPKTPETTETEDLGLLKLNKGFNVQDKTTLKQNNAIASVITSGNYQPQAEKLNLPFYDVHAIEYLNSLSIANIYLFSNGEPYSKSNEGFKIFTEEKKTSKGYWENTIFISPEFSLSKPDSVTILNSYSIGVEPSRFFNKHLFVRFGLNISFTGDRGFAKIDYISNDMMGTYEDVYDVTFDTINDVITPIYHTKTVEVWDSIRHIVVSEVTNRYLFAQIPVMIGYKNKVGKLHWYVFGGPAFGFQITKWIDKTNIDAKDIDIIDFNNRLPLRSTINYQIWVGAGIEYKLSRNYSIVIEPLFKHYFNSLYSHDNYKNNTSGFALRIGFNYKIGN